MQRDHGKDASELYSLCQDVLVRKNQPVDCYAGYNKQGLTPFSLNLTQDGNSCIQNENFMQQHYSQYSLALARTGT